MQVLMSQLEPLTDQQLVDVCNLRQSSQQAEDALSQGIDKLQQTLAQSIAADITSGGSYAAQMAAAVEKLEALEGFVNQVLGTYWPFPSSGSLCLRFISLNSFMLLELLPYMV